MRLRRLSEKKWWRWVAIAILTCCLVLSTGFSPVWPQPTPPPVGHERRSLSFEQRLQQGQHYYADGQFTAAVGTWQQALQLASSLTTREQAIALNYLSIGHQALGDWDAAAATVEQAVSQLDPALTPFLYAQVLNTRGNLQFQTGQPEAALTTWKQAERLYRQQPSPEGVVRSQINQAQALRRLGHYRQARQVLGQAETLLSTLPAPQLKVKALQSLGITQRAMGDLTTAQATLTEAIALANTLPATDLSSVRLSLAKTLVALGKNDQALAIATQLAQTAPDARLQLEAELLQLDLWQTQEQWDRVRQFAPQRLQQLQDQPASRWVIDGQVHLAASLLKHQVAHPVVETHAIATHLADAVRKAQTLSDPRAEAQALGQLGSVYEQQHQWSAALNLTQRAVALAHQTQSTDILAKWQWQQGRILTATGKNEAAIAAYTQAVQGLEVLQQDLVAIDPEVQFSFREQVEPVYRQLVQLLLSNVDTLPERQRQDHLSQARSVIESLQVAELQNYFRAACQVYKTQPIETIDPKAAIIYPILLGDRLEVIAELPGQPLQHYGQNLPQAEQQQLFQSLFWRLYPLNDPTGALDLTQQLYDWLVRPVADALETQKITTLVFVPDRFLRSVPMATLHDGHQYLIENYRITLTPGLQLLNSQPLASKTLRVLTAGISKARGGFSAIPAVEQELDQINDLIKSKTLFNEAFTKAQFLQQARTATGIVHLATHGQFSSKIEDTFLLAWDDRIQVQDLDRLFQQPGQRPLELLVLSACQTASGDERAALGIAGIAVRSGARSTLATLWTVDDESTAQLMTQFYRTLIQAPTHRAEALRQAQLSLLNTPQYRHPYYWAPFVLVGNWQ